MVQKWHPPCQDRLLGDLDFFKSTEKKTDKNMTKEASLAGRQGPRASYFHSKTQENASLRGGQAGSGFLTFYLFFLSY